MIERPATPSQICELLFSFGKHAFSGPNQLAIKAASHEATGGFVFVSVQTNQLA
jgi:hypothetical protein